VLLMRTGYVPLTNLVKELEKHGIVG